MSKKVTSLIERIFEYIKSISQKTSEIYRKDVVKHFEKIYGIKRSTLSTIRAATDLNLKYLCVLGFIKRQKTPRGYYRFIKNTC